MTLEMPTDENPVVVVEGDCLEVLRGLPDGCVDAVVTDPPYGISNESYDSAAAPVFYPAFWSEVWRVCGDNAAAMSFGHTSTYHRLACAAEFGGWKVRQMWAWVYRDGLITSAYPRDGFDRLAPAMDPILYATTGKVLLNIDREGDNEWTRPVRRDGSMSGRDNLSKAANKSIGRYPRAIVSDGVTPFEYFAASRTRPGSREGSHPNEKPLDLMRWLVAKLPTPSVILDPFAGSGTTGVAAIAEGRRAILIEKESKYADICRRRVAEAMGLGEGSLLAALQPSLFGESS
jgi:site-specific DNA-methyltransferase (adenine-specific)